MVSRRTANIASLIVITAFAAPAVAQISVANFCSSTAHGQRILAAYFQRSALKRLILKNGEYQPADNWVVKGDRVRYHSSERNEWEEIPASMVDWPATEKWNSAAPATTQQRSEEMQKADEEYAAAVKEDEAAHPEVAPGLRLPDDSSAEGGVYLLDTYQDKPELVEIVQSGGELNKQMGKNILRAVVNPLPTGSRQTIELPGRHARIEAHVPQPSIYINMLADKDMAGPAPLPNDQRWKIIRIEQTKDGRIISKVKTSLLGKASENEDVIPAKIQKAGNDWIQVTPAQELGIGQYALVEMLSPTEINMNVWDFGINPSGPENPATRNDQKKNPFDNGYSRLDTGSEEQQPKKEKKPKN
jgi:hypothetical protein